MTSPTEAQIPSQLSETDRLRLLLAREKSARLQAEMSNVQMVQRSVQTQLAQIEAENKAFRERLKVEYRLAPADEIGEDGSIKRSQVRSVSAPFKEEG